MKIDLHCHTKKVKKGDAATRNVTADLFRDKIELADVKIVAITNHNAFDL
jgi:predicted metal-dependent phosphoesterase TrpH